MRCEHRERRLVDACEVLGELEATVAQIVRPLAQMEVGPEEIEAVIVELVVDQLRLSVPRGVVPDVHARVCACVCVRARACVCRVCVCCGEGTVCGEGTAHHAARGTTSMS